ncbi:MAG: DNA polymerase III subunit beta [Defluviitaleaceae bacterium]|nr:DNA polymerase III subunit beta [Defluviitaleaceae bacterium]
MHIVCPKQKLLDSINIALKAVSVRTTLPILECILIIADDKGVKLLSNDLEMGIETSPMTADDGVDVIEQGSVALEAKIFAEMIRRLPDADVRLTVDNNNLTHIECAKSKFKILGLSGEDFPYLPQVEKELMLTVKAEALKNAVRQTIFSAAVDESKPAFTGELFDIRQNELNVVTVDGYRVSHRRLEVDTELIHSAIIPAKSLTEINRIITGDSDINVYFTERHVLFEMNECTVVSRLLEGEFIKYDSVFDMTHTTEIMINRQEYLMALERAMLISAKDAKKNPVKLEIGGDGLIIKSNTENGTSYEELDIELTGAEMEISFNPRYLIDALKAIDEDRVCVRFSAALSPCVMTGEGNTEARYLVLPLRNMR